MGLVDSKGSLATFNPPALLLPLLPLLFRLGEPLGLPLGGLGETGGRGEVQLEPQLLALGWGGVKRDAIAALVWKGDERAFGDARALVLVTCREAGDAWLLPFTQGWLAICSSVGLS